MNEPPTPEFSAAISQSGRQVSQLKQWPNELPDNSASALPSSSTRAGELGAMWLMVPQLIRFCSVGALCLAASTAVLAALHELAGMYYLAAYAISFCVGNLLGYLLNGRFTFSTRVSASGGARYLFLNGALLAVSSLLMKLLVDGAHVWYMFAFLMLALANTPISFLLHRRFSYVQPSRRGPLSQLSGSAQQ